MHCSVFPWSFKGADIALMSLVPFSVKAGRHLPSFMIHICGLLLLVICYYLMPFFLSPKVFSPVYSDVIIFISGVNTVPSAEAGT